MSALRQLIAKFWIDADTEKVEKAEKEVDGFVEKLKSVAEVVAEAFAFEKVKEFVEGQTEAATQLKRTATMLGTTTDELQAMNLAAQEADVTADDMTISLRILNRNISEALEKGGDAAQVFHKLGISLKNQDGTTRAAGDVMADFADAIASIQDPAKQTALAMQVLGRGGAQMLPLLKKGGAAFEDARKQVEDLGGGIKEGFIEQAEEAATQTAKMQFALTGLKSNIASALLPILQKFVEAFTSIIQKTQEFTKHTHVLSTGLTFLGSIAAIKAIQSVAQLARKFDLLKPGVIATVRAMMGFALPIVLLGLLYLGFDELWTLLEGGDTLIGDALGPDKSKFIYELRDALGELLDAFKELLGDVSDDGTAMDGFRVIVVETAKALKYLVELMAAVVEGGKKIGEGIGGLIFHSAETDETGGLKEGGLTPKAKAMLLQMQQNGNPQAISAGPMPEADAHLGRMRELVQQMAAAKHGGVSGAPGDHPYGAGPNMSGNVFGPQPVLASGFVGPLAPGEKSVTVNQQNHTTVEVHTTTDKPQEVGDKVAGGVSTANQRNMDRARNALRQP